MERLIKKRLIFLALFLCFSLLSIKVYDTYAVSGKVSLTYVKSWIFESDTQGDYSNGKRIRVGDNIAYCVEPGVNILNGASYESVSYQKLGLSDSLAKKLSLISAYGYGYQGRTNGDWEGITQGLIWKELGRNRYWYTETAKTKAELVNRWNQILHDVERYSLRPDFGSTSISVNVNDTVVLTDGHNVISDMEIVSKGGLDVQIQGNKMTIKASDSSNEKEKIMLRKKVPQGKAQSIYWYNAGSQNLASFSVSEEIELSINVTVEKKGDLKLRKQDLYKELIDGAIVEVWNSEYHKEITITNGEILLEDLEYGNYKIKEIKAPLGYVLDTTIYEVTIQPKETTTFILTNTEPTASILCTKKDKETSENAQGDASLVGAKYGVYAKEDIYTASKKKRLFNKDELVETLVINENHQALVESIPLGNYYVKELVPSLGYLLDEQKYDVNLIYQNQLVEVIFETLVVEEEIMKRPIKIMKISSKESEVTKGVEGVAFEIRLKSEIASVGYENAKIYDTIITNSKGEAVSKALPYGTYIIKESSTLEHLIPIEDFEVTITEHSKEPLLYIINNEQFEAYIKIVKKDIETKKTILYKNAAFKIYDMDHNYYITQKVGSKKIDVFTTNDEGVVTTALKLPYGNYRIEEIRAPYGYLLNQTPVEFKATYYSQIEIDEDGDFTLVLEMFDKQVKGKIELKKEGEVLIKHEHNQFIYEKRGLKGAVFELYADEDIYSSDTKELLYQKNELVTKKESGENGIVIFDDLPLGIYKIKESKAPTGYEENGEEYRIDITYIDEYTAENYQSQLIENTRIPYEVSVQKQDAETKEGLGEATFGIYNTKVIYDYLGNIIFEKDSLIEMIVSDEKGIAKSKKDLPYQEYYVKEITAPLGYVTTDTMYPYQHKRIIIENQSTTVDISKIDITTTKELAGATLALFDSNDVLIEEWISSDIPHRIKGLHVGKTYTLIEKESPYGFSVSEPVTFTVEDKEELQSVFMYNNLIKGNVHFTKTGAIFTEVAEEETVFGTIYQPMFETSKLETAEITIYAAEDIILGNGIKYYELDEAITVVSSLEGISEDLIVGKYYALETKVPNSFIQDNNKYYFEILNNGENTFQQIELTIMNERGSVYLHLNKVLEKNELYKLNPQAYKDVIFGIYTKNNLYNEYEEMMIEEECLVALLTMGENGEVEERIELPFGEYYVKELQTANGYYLLEETFDFSIVYKGKDVMVYHIYINEGEDIHNLLKKSNIGILKVDKKDEALQLSGATFTLYDEEYQPLLTSVSDYQGFAYLENIPYGKYYVKETNPPIDYVIDDNYYEIMLDEEFNQENYAFLTIANSHYETPILNDESNPTMYHSIIYIVGIIMILINKKKNKLLLR